MAPNCTCLDKIRSYRVFDMAIFDWVVTLLAAWAFINYVVPNVRSLKRLDLTPCAWILGIVVLGIFLHWLFRVPTVVGHWVGLSKYPAKKDC